MEATLQNMEQPSGEANMDGQPELTSASAMSSAVQPKQPATPSSSAMEDSEMKPSDEVSKGSKTQPSPVPSRSSALQIQIQALAALQTRMARIRSLPAHLLIFHTQSPLISFGGLSGLGLGDGNGPSESDTIDSILNPDAGTEAATQAREMGSQALIAFRMLGDAREELVKDVTQGALKAARESEELDKTDIVLHSRRARKKRRIATADSPAPFPASHLETTHVFPSPQQKDKKIEGLDDLVLFIRAHNRSKSNPIDQRSRTQLGIWAPSRRKSGAPRCVSDTHTVRVTIRDVTTVFVKLRHRDPDRETRELCVESVVALGPREKKSPYSHSDFTVYQKLTQQISQMVEKEPKVSLTQLVELLTSYEELFNTPCTVCRRVLPLEGHVPPVARVWKGSSNTTEGERGDWEPRHVSCLHA